MNIEEIRQLVLQYKGINESFPFNEDTLVFKVGGKMMLLCSLDRNPLAISVKTKPKYSVELREKYSTIKGAYHLNKTHWNQLELDNLPKKLIIELIQQSYDLVYQSLSKKQKIEIDSSF